jgi:hypothetical protein
MQDNQHTLSFLHTLARLNDVLDTLDAVHNAASEQTLDTLNQRGSDELIARLQEIAYVANETITELQQAATYQAPALRVVKGGGAQAAGENPGSPGERAAQPDLAVLVTADDTPRPLKVMKQAGH